MASESLFAPYPVEFSEEVLPPWRPRRGSRRRGISPNPFMMADAAVDINWRTRSNLFPAVDQQRYNTCTAFALCGIVADLARIRGVPNPRALSPGHLHWCLANLGPDDPLGPDTGISLFRQKAVAASRSGDYPFDPNDCTTAIGVAKIRSRVGLYTADDAKAALQAGPIFAVMDLYPDFWERYQGGIYRSTSGRRTAHSVEIVGYDDGEQAWILKNSHGSAWGEHGGYARVAYGECRIFSADGHGGYQINI